MLRRSTPIPTTIDELPPLKDGEQKVFFQAGGEWCYLWTPDGFRRDTPVPVVIHHHGAGGYVRQGSADWLKRRHKRKLLGAIMAACNCAVAGTHACGNNWGSPCAVEANAALFQVLDDSPFLDGDRLGLLGGGMGAALVWNSVLGPLSGKAKAAAVMQGVGSLEAVIRAHLYGEYCLRAYDLLADLDDETAIAELAPHDPLRQFQRLAPGIPLPQVAIYHGLVDIDLRPEPHATALAQAIQQAGGDVLLEVIPAVDHNLYALGKEMEQRLAGFFSSSI